MSKSRRSVQSAVLCLFVLLTVSVSLSGCGTLGIGSRPSGGGSLGDGQLDILQLLGVVAGLRGGDPAPLCAAILGGSGSELGELAPVAETFCADLVRRELAPAPIAATMVVPPPGPACESLKVAVLEVCGG